MHSRHREAALAAAGVQKRAQRLRLLDWFAALATTANDQN
jgi:hypothetical protein